MIEDDSFALPVCRELFDKVNSNPKEGEDGDLLFTSLDLVHSFFQIALEHESRSITAFGAPDGQIYQWEVLPQGLKVSPQGFCRALSSVLKTHLDTGRCFLYLDDLIIYSRRSQEGSVRAHLEEVSRILDTLLEAGLRIRPDKFVLGVSKIKILGFDLSNRGITPTDTHLKTVQELRRPETLKQLRSFTGLTQFFREFNKDYAKIARPLHHLTRKNSKFIWDDNCQKAFDQLKIALTTKPVLALPIWDRNARFYLFTDASRLSLG